MKIPEITISGDDGLFGIRFRIRMGEPVTSEEQSLLDQRQEMDVFAKLMGDVDKHLQRDDVQAQMNAMNKQLTDSAGTDGGTTG